MEGQSHPTSDSRRVISILFCDVVGSTELAEGLDPESVRAMMSQYFAAARTAVQQFGGRVEKFIGDAVVGAFGVPTLHEDDALRAVRAALQVQAVVAELNIGFERQWGRSIVVRIGVNTGEVVAGEIATEQAFLSGDAVNVAARLEQSAAGGEILIGEATRQLVRDAARLVPIGELRLKGKAQSVRTWRLEGLGGSPPGGGFGSPWVGRVPELARLARCWHDSVSQACCRLATMLGAPGIGKSRLVGEFVDRVQAGATVLTGRCLPYGEGTTFWPLVEALRDLAGVESSDGPAEVRGKLEGLFPDRTEAPPVVDVVLGVLGLAPAAAREETFWAVRRLLEVAAGRRPVLLVLDDLQWAEPTLIELLEYLRDWGRAAPILILLVARPELRVSWPALVAARPGQDVLQLGALAPAESRLLATQLLGRAADQLLMDEVVRVAEGNPLFVAEILRMMVDDGVLHQQEGGWRRPEEAGTVEVPLSIQALLSARLDRLPQDDRVVIERAAVVGEHFFRGPVVELSPDSVGGRIDHHLALLVGRELIAGEESTWTGEDAYRFSHLLIRDAAYRRVLKHDRAVLHERLAGWLERRAATLTGLDVDDLVGYHLEQACIYLQQLGRLNEHGQALGRRAADRLHRSGRRALDRGDLPAAAALLRRVRALAKDDVTTAVDVQLDQADCAVAQGDVAGADRTLTEVTAALPFLAEVAVATTESIRARIVVTRCELRMLTAPGRLSDDVAEVETAIAALAQAGASPALAGHARMVLGRALAMTGRLADAERELDRAVILARQAGDPIQARKVLLQLPLVALWGPLPVTKANGRLTDSLRVLRLRPGNRGVEAETLRCMGLLEAMRARFEPARALLASAGSMFDELGSPIGLGEVESSLGLVELMADRLEPAAQTLAAAYQRFDVLGVAAGAGRAASWLAEVRYRQHEWDDAHRWTGVAAEIGATRSRDAVVWQGVRAKLAAEEGDRATARMLARDALALVEATDALVDHADALITLARVLRLGRRPEQAEALGRQAEALYAAKGHVVGVTQATTFIGPGRLA
jgi:class 3 adenylate cyclase/tetratricopeptide (TPR) repeat protein